MNNDENLPVIIDEPGYYKNRSGKIVLVVDIDADIEDAHNCEGVYIESNRDGQQVSKWCYWSYQGRYLFTGEHPLDIVEKIKD